MMRVCKRGGSLAVRIAKAIVDELGLRAGDEIDLKVVPPDTLLVCLVSGDQAGAEGKSASRMKSS